MAEQQAARLAEEECQTARTEAISRAKKVQKGALKLLEDCKAEYAKQLISFKAVEDYCKSEQGQFDAAGGQLNSAKARTCSTGVIIRKP
jgi:hypothetical protein